MLRLLETHSGALPGLARRLRFLSLLFPLLLLASCDSGSTGPDGNEIGESGGDVSLAGGLVKLSIPAEALGAPVAFSATPSASFLPSDLIVAGSVYDLLPMETSFTRGARLTLSYDPARIPAGVREGELRLFKAEGAGWVPVANRSVDTEAHSVFGTVSSLGRFAAMGVPVARVTIFPAFFALGKGQTRQFTAAGLDDSGTSLPDRALTWTSSDEELATVDGEGLATATGAGQDTIWAAAEGAAAFARLVIWSCSEQTQVPEADCEALIDVYSWGNHEDWRFSPSWVSDADPCSWAGVTCTGGVVSELRLSARALEGSIPSAIGNFTQLRSLDLRGNQLAGTIPKALGNLSSLTQLNLFANLLSGAIPSELQGLTNIEVIDLAGNQLSGLIPSGLGTLVKLQDLNLNWNQLSGPVPLWLADLPELSTVSLMDNQLTGSIPPELEDASGLTELSLAFNLLSGSIPPGLGALKSLTRLSLSHNQLSGPIPAEIGNLTKLTSLFLDFNELSGVVPLAVAQLGAQIQATTGDIHSCAFGPSGNDGLSLPDTQEYRDADLNGDGKICGLVIGS